MEYIFVTLVIIIICLFFYFKSLKKRKVEEKSYIELKQKCLDLCRDIDNILNDILIYLNDKKIFLESIKKIDEDIYEDDMKYYELESFLDEEIENTNLLRDTNKEYFAKLEKLDSINVDKSNLTLSLNKKDYCLERKEKIINKYKDFYDELNIGSIL
jgi:hypothetical protein